MSGQERTGLSHMPEGAVQQSKRNLWHKETGRQRSFYHVDARAILAQKESEYVSSPSLLSPEVQKQIGYTPGTRAKIVVEPTMPSDVTTKVVDNSDTDVEDDLGESGENVPPPAPTTWNDWTDAELSAKAREFKVRKFSQKSRDELIEALEEVGVIPSDDKFVPQK